MPAGVYERVPVDPTPAEIAAECARIQAGWDWMTEEMRRGIGHTDPYRPGTKPTHRLGVRLAPDRNGGLAALH